MSAAEQDVAGAAGAGAKRAKTEYEKITMTDGRVVEFPKNRKLSKQSFIPGEDGHKSAPGVRLDFANGETRFVVIPGGEILMDFLGGDENLDKRLRHLMKAATHGYEQKLGDEMAYTPKKDEPEPSLEDKIAWIDELISRLGALEWTAAREGGGGLTGAASLLQALVELSGKTKEEMQAFLKPLSREDRAALKRTSPVKEKIHEIEEAIAKKNGVDGAAIFAKLFSPAS